MVDFVRADRETLESMLRSPMIGDAAKERILARLAEITYTPEEKGAAHDPGLIAPPAAAGELIEKPAPAAGGKRRGIPNRTEQRFAREVLDPMVARGEILSYEFEPVTFHLLDVARYTPDYLGRLPGGGLRAFEVKRQQVWEKDKIRWKAHSKARPWIWWTMVKREGQGWKVIHDRKPEQERS